ncbi:hypothetical protein BASA81_003058 [Batrachochytrium salamandrivorans]|nr:hypothetical protein BASA81_003058 [Batrachochytrium salamandrivorans]
MDGKSVSPPPSQFSSFTKVHITHVFSSFSTPIGSVAYREMSLVQLSLLKASEFAKTTGGLNVEFIDTTLPLDAGSSPSFAWRYNLTSYFLSANNDGSQSKQIPTVGEYFSIALTKGRGEFVLSTNADIGVTEDFYVRIYAWANRNYQSNEVQLEAMKIAAKTFAECALMRIDAMDSVRFCAQDTRQVYINEGGFEELYTKSLVRELALLACQHMLRMTDIRDPKWFETILSTLPQSSLLGSFVFDEEESKGDWEDLVINFFPRGPQSFESIIQQPTLFAGTITRLDFPHPEDALKRTGQTMQEALDFVLAGLPNKGLLHPGNDLFMMHRQVIATSQLDKFHHPTGLRPFGAWIPVLITNAHIPFRRIASTKRNVWSFHVGVGKWGGSKINFRERLEKNPLMTLFLVSNFDRIGGGVFQRQFSNAPRLCKESIRGWRDITYCHSNPSKCVGMMRVSCEKYMNMDLRDAKLYAQECNRLLVSSSTPLGKRIGIQEPVCSFCNFMLSTHHSCTNGTMKFCDHLVPGACV